MSPGAIVAAGARVGVSGKTGLRTSSSQTDDDAHAHANSGTASDGRWVGIPKAKTFASWVPGRFIACSIRLDS